MGNITNAEREAREKKFRDEPKVLTDFPFTCFRTKEEWLRHVEMKWASFIEAFEDSGINMGSAFFPRKVIDWLSQLKYGNDGDNIDKLMKDYFNGKGNQALHYIETPISIYEEIKKKGRKSIVLKKVS